MHEDDLIHEARRALDDLVELAPEAPSLRSITAGYATLRRVEPPLTRWRPIVILAAAAAVTLLVVGIASLIGSNVTDSDGVAGPGVTTTTSEPSVEGIWVLAAYTSNDTTQAVDEAALTANGRVPAWIEISGDTLTGYTGCNGVSPTTVALSDGDRLVFGEIVVEAAGCVDETPEPAVLAALETGSDGVGLTIDGDTMTWTTDAVTLTFERRDRYPTAAPVGWASSIGRLDCSPGVYLTRTIPVTGQPPSDLLDALMAVPGVTTVEEGDPFWWGLDGGIIAGGTYGDVEPRVIQIVACAETYGVRAGTDLAGQTSTWVNGLGLTQTSPLVWGERFIELCSADDPDLVVLAERYLEEDAATSVRSDGSLPTVEEAAQMLEIIQRSTCDPDRAPTTTVPPPDAQDGLATTTTVVSPASGSGIGDQPEITDEIVSPSWVTVDDEDPGAIIRSVRAGGEAPTLSNAMVRAVLANLPPDGWRPYLYRATMAGDVPIQELLEVSLGNADVLSVTWYYRWDDTPGCDVCDANAVGWDNGWMVWTDADPASGVILYHATHPDLPLNARIAFLPDPIEWPEARPEDDPVLRTTAEEADALAAAILDSLATAIPPPP